MCQCPSGLSFISTKYIIFQMHVKKNVSMPFWAFLHFYMLKFLITQFLKYLCQCPSGLSFISTRRLYRRTDCFVVCQCPSGLSFISTYKHKWSIVTRPVCVNALSGFPSFLQHPSGTRRNKAFSRPFLQVFI